MKAKRNLSIDYLRIFATFLVIINHSNSIIFLNYSPSKSAIFSLNYFFFSKVAVGVFFVISGALLLKKEESIYDTYKRRLLPIIFLIVSVSLYYYLRPMVKIGDFTSLSITSFLISIIAKPYVVSLWYLYVYAGLLLSLPFLRKMTMSMKNSDYIIFILISLLFSSLPLFLKGLNGFVVSEYLTFGLFQMYISYFIAGNYIFNMLKKDFFNGTGSIICLIIFIITIITPSIITYNNYLSTGTYYLGLSNPSSLLVAIGVFCNIYMFIWLDNSINISNFFKKIIVSISSTTLIIYLTHEYFIVKLSYYFDKLGFEIGLIPKMILLQFTVFLSCYILGLILINLKVVMLNLTKKYIR